MARRSQNGPTLTKAPPKKRGPMTDTELADQQARQAETLEQKKRDAAKERLSHQRLRADPVSYLQELAKKNQGK